MGEERGGGRQRSGPRNATLASILLVGAALSALVGASRGETLVTADGRERAYLLVEPSAAEAGEPLPLVILLHEEFGSPETVLAASGLASVAEDRGFFLAVPSGSSPMEQGAIFGSGVWNAGFCCGLAARDGVDDIGFIRALIERLAVTHPIDRRRVYLVGYRSGGALARRVACAVDGIAGVAVVAGDESLDAGPLCGPKRGVALLSIYGLDDPCAPADGGPSCGGCAERFGQAIIGLKDEALIPSWSCPPLAERLAPWRRASACLSTSAVIHDEPGVRCRTYEGCADEAAVTACAVERHGHTWPGSQICASGGSVCDTITRVFGPTERDFDASSYIWRFLSAHRAPLER